MSLFTKRKRSRKDPSCSLFPDSKNALKKQAPVGGSVPSTAIRSWERRGEGFLGTPVTQRRSSRKGVKAVRQLVPSSSVPVKEDIVWSSSGSDLSDCGIPEPSKVTERHGAPLKEGARNSYSRFLGLFSSGPYCEQDECHKIDWDSDFDDDDDGEEMESLAEISENDSSSEDQKLSPKTPLALDVEISDLSDGAEPLARWEPGSWPPDGTSRSASDWVRCAQIALRTPQKPHRHAKPPEDSAKKRRKFLSGGLAERLSRLQCRQRSAISFWRHQSISDSKTPAAGKVGVLVLKLLSVWEDCNMWAAMCQGDSAPCGAPRVLVLFSRDTAAHLVPSPGDTVHVYPPWQKLLMDGESNPVILNTHFSQKVLEDGAHTRDRVSAMKCGPYPLSRVFSLMEKSSISEDQLAVKPSGPQAAAERTCDSLLELIESHGVAGWTERDVSVLVQRVYCLHIQEPSCQPLLKHRVAERGSIQRRNRLCLLVQDAYGLFSEVSLHVLSSEDSLQQYIRKWEGRCCVLRGLRVQQRVTRARSPELFSLIDSLWPPSVPLRGHGEAQSSREDRAKLPEPSFCYLLSGERGQNCVEELLRPHPTLYLPAEVHTLREILQHVPQGQHCSFTATVLHKRLQGSSPRQSELWLFVTDPSLQAEQREQSEEWSRTLGVCVSSCVLPSAVLRALGTSSCRLAFKDAVREHGLIQCMERSVIQLAPEGPALPPASLDQLGPATAANSLCTLQGVVVGVDEDTAYSWPACNLCGHDQLQASDGER